MAQGLGFGLTIQILVVQFRADQFLVILFIIKLNTLKRSYYKFCKLSVNDCAIVYALNFIIFDEYYEISPKAAFLVYSSNFVKLS